MNTISQCIAFVRDSRYRVARAWAALIFIGCVVGVVYLFSGYGVNYSETDAGHNAEYWKHVIAAHGTSAAYTEFKQRNAHAPFDQQHFSAHVFGSLIADTDGVAGVTVCDASFAFGCFHGYFARLISTSGTDAVRALDTACVQKYGPFGTGCQHGIGHGILEYVGYQHITKALDLCKLTTQKVPLLGCTSGVFMEYSTPLQGPDGTLTPGQRPLDQQAPYAPCTTVAPEFRASCYFELGHWYVGVAGPNPAALESYCTHAPHEYAPYCFLGIGDTVGPRTQYDLTKSLALCDAFSGTNQTYCRAGVSWSMRADPAQRSKASAACALPDSTQAALCTAFADLTEGQANQ